MEKRGRLVGAGEYSCGFCAPYKGLVKGSTVAKAQHCSADQAFGPWLKGRPGGFQLPREAPSCQSSAPYRPHTGVPAAAWAGDQRSANPGDILHCA